MGSTQLESVTIQFRDLRAEDKDMVRGWRNLPHIRRYMLTDHEISPIEHEAWFRKISGNPSYRHWIIDCDNHDVGLLYLYDIDQRNRRCYWGFYVVGANVRGKSVGAFAEYFILQHVFEEMHFHKLCCECLAFNRGVLRMHKGFGFVQEGVLREHVVRKDSKYDVVCLGILASEWEEKRSEFERIFKSKGLL
jgi:UDP-4-amino-4,6-dideoxy-N-acetyl-beta-L-altrosamine N-acetyltransferase